MAYDPNEDIKRGYASAPRGVYTGTPDNYVVHHLKPGDKIPEGAKSRPWFLGREEKPTEPAKKPAAKKSPTKKGTVTKKKSSSSSEQDRASGTSTTKELKNTIL